MIWSVKPVKIQVFFLIRRSSLLLAFFVSRMASVPHHSILVCVFLFHKAECVLAIHDVVQLIVTEFSLAVIFFHARCYVFSPWR